MPEFDRNKSPQHNQEPNRSVSHQLHSKQNQTHSTGHSEGLVQLQTKADRSQQVAGLVALQNKANMLTNTGSIQTKPNRTGLPDQLKSGIENLSGYTMDDVKVHYNSAKPAQLNAHAYAQGTNIHLASGQEKHLPHEAWHVVQQKQGRVRPTMQFKVSGIAINDEKGLEHEADLMGARALQMKALVRDESKVKHSNSFNPFPLAQLVKTEAGVKDELRDGGILNNFAVAFISRHIGLGVNDNVKAARIHAARADPPVTNTVFADARALKTALRNGAWVSRDGHWEVTTVANVALQSTTKQNAAIGPPPAGAIHLTLTGAGDQADHFTVVSGVVTSITGATEAEVAAAVAAKGAYPTSGSSSTLRSRRRVYRQGLVNHINQVRSDAASNTLVAWVKAQFASIGTTAMHGNAAIVTEANINAVADRQKRVEIHIDKDSGNIYHMHAEI